MENAEFLVLDGGLGTELARAGFLIDVSSLCYLDHLKVPEDHTRM